MRSISVSWASRLVNEIPVASSRVPGSVHERRGCNDRRERNWRLKGCPRCNGDQRRFEDGWVCLQCGCETSLEALPTLERRRA